MDFIWSADSRDLDALTAAMRAVGAPQDSIVLAESGRWGAVVATRSPYFGLQPSSDESSIVVIAGDPLLPFDDGSSRAESGDPACRTRSIKAFWDDRARDMRSLAPHHPAALLRVDKQSGEAEVILDAYGAVPVYRATWRERPIVATSADLIASVLRPALDKLSAVELLTASRISFPYTPYRGITQVPPGCIYEAESGKSTKWWNPPLPQHGVDPQEWGRRLRSALTGTLRRIARSAGTQGITTLSAGQDARALASLAAGRLNLEAVTITAMPNPESWAARRNARRLGIPLRHVIRRPAHYGDILLAPLMLTTQNHWTHAHFHLNALNTPADARFVLGGYLADTLFRRGGISFTKWQKLLADTESGSPAFQSVKTWMTEPWCLDLDVGLRDAITERWERGDALLGLTSEHAIDVAVGWPLTRAVSGCHFNASRRSGPQYELFMTQDALDLGFRVPAELKKTGPESINAYAFAAENDLFTDIERFKTRVKSAIETRRRSLPKSRTPKWWRLQGAWGSIVSPGDDDRLKPALQRAKLKVPQTLGVTFPTPLPRDLDEPLLQVQAIMDVCDRGLGIQGKPRGLLRRIWSRLRLGRLISRDAQANS